MEMIGRISCKLLSKIKSTASQNLVNRSNKHWTQLQINKNQFEKDDQRRRVVVTGLGVVSPVGCNVKLAWENIINGYCGIKTLNDPAYESLPCKIAAKISEEDLNLDDHFSKSERRSFSSATAYALIAGNYWI